MMTYCRRITFPVLLKAVAASGILSLLCSLIIPKGYADIISDTAVEFPRVPLYDKIETVGQKTRAEKAKQYIKDLVSGKMPLIDVFVSAWGNGSVGIINYPGTSTEPTSKGGGIKRSKSTLDISSASAATGRKSSESMASQFCGAAGSAAAGYSGVPKSLNIPNVASVSGSMSIDSTPSLWLLPGLGDDLNDFMRMVLPGITDEMIESLKSGSTNFIRAYRIQLPYFKAKGGRQISLSTMGDVVATLGKMDRHGGEELSAAQREVARTQPIRNTILFQFITEIRRILSGESDQRVQSVPGLRTESYTIQNERGEPVSAMDLQREVGLVQNTIRGASRSLSLRRGEVDKLLDTRQAPGNQWHLISRPPAKPELVNFPLELALYYLFQEMPKAIGFSQFIDTLAKFAVVFNLMRPFQYCNETTLANTLNFVLMLYQGPGAGKTNYQNQFHFPTLESLSTVSLDQMIGVLYDALRMVSPFTAEPGRERATPSADGAGHKNGERSVDQQSEEVEGTALPEEEERDDDDVDYV